MRYLDSILPRLAGRWGVGTLIAGLVLFVLLFVAMPMVASTRIVRDRIALEMSAWSGYRVEIAAPPEIRLFPFRAVLRDVRFIDWAGGGPPALETEEISVNLSELAALTGEIEFSRLRLSKPVLRVEPTPSGVHLPRFPAGGRIASAVDRARAAIAADAANPDTGVLDGSPFGSIEFTEGRIVSASNDSELVTGVTGALDWSRLNGAGSIKAIGAWRGETISVELSAAQPILLLGGGQSAVRLALGAKIANASFDGVVNPTVSFYDGSLAFTTQSLSTLLAWSWDAPAVPQNLDAMSVSGGIRGDQARIQLSDGAFSFNGSSGSLVGDVALSGPQPVFSATFDMPSVDLTPLAAAIFPVAGGSVVPGAEIDASFPSRFALDLRLSARQAILGSVTLSDLAGTAQLRDGLAVFDISDAKVLGGSLQAGLRFDEQADGTRLEATVRAADLDAARLSEGGSVGGMTLAGRAGVALNLKAQAVNWSGLLASTTGGLNATLSQGNIGNFSLSEFNKRLGEGGFFALRNVGGGGLNVDSVDAKIAVASGVMRVEDIQVKAGQNRIGLAGAASLGGGLALRGAVSPSADPAAPPTSRFFVGGSWSDPIVSPAFQPSE